MKKIPLGHGRVALVDNKDFRKLNKFKWHYHYAGYAIRNGTQKNHIVLKPAARMHRVILNAKAEERCDHISRNGLDNRRSNLRIATPQQNGFNRSANKNNKCGLKGASWDKGTQKWRGRMILRGHNIHLGLYDNKESAYIAYCFAAVLCHGEFACG